MSFIWRFFNLDGARSEDKEKDQLFLGKTQNNDLVYIQAGSVIVLVVV